MRRLITLGVLVLAVVGVATYLDGAFPTSSTLGKLEQFRRALKGVARRRGASASDTVPSTMSSGSRDWLCRRIVEDTPDTVVFADRDGVIRLWNSAAEAMFGYSADEALGQTLDLVVPQRHRDAHWEGFRRVVATGVSKYGTELLKVPALRKDGSRISLEFSIALVRDEDDRVAGVAAVMRDVTARWLEEKALHERLAASEAQLAAAGLEQPWKKLTS